MKTAFELLEDIHQAIVHHMIMDKDHYIRCIIVSKEIYDIFKEECRIRSLTCGVPNSRMFVMGNYCVVDPTFKKNEWLVMG